VTKREDKTSLGRPRRRVDDNIKMDMHELEWDMDWIDLAKVRVR
jgi:hypothetical protein